jgi:hypothetical protein
LLVTRQFRQALIHFIQISSNKKLASRKQSLDQKTPFIFSSPQIRHCYSTAHTRSFTSGALKTIERSGVPVDEVVHWQRDSRVNKNPRLFAQICTSLSLSLSLSLYIYHINVYILFTLKGASGTIGTLEHAKDPFALVRQSASKNFPFAICVCVCVYICTHPSFISFTTQDRLQNKEWTVHRANTHPRATHYRSFYSRGLWILKRIELYAYIRI